MMMNTTNQMLITFLLNSARSLAASEQCPFGVRCRYGASRCWYQHSATTDRLTPATRSHYNYGQPRDLWTHQPYNSPCSPLAQMQQQQNNKDLLHPANQLSKHPNLEGNYQKQHPPFEKLVSHSHAFQTAPPAQVSKQQDEAYKMEQPTPNDASTSAPDQSDHQVCSPPLHDDQSPARKRDQTQIHSPPWTSTISSPEAPQSKPIASHRNQWTDLSDQLSTKSSTSEPWEEPRRRKHTSKPPAEPKDNSDEHGSCTDCVAAFELSKELQLWYTNKGFVHPKRCPTCRKNIKEKREGRLAKPAKVIHITTPPLQTQLWNVPSSKPRSDDNQPNELLQRTLPMTMQKSKKAITTKTKYPTTSWTQQQTLIQPLPAPLPSKVLHAFRPLTHCLPQILSSKTQSNLKTFVRYSIFNQKHPNLLGFKPARSFTSHQQHLLTIVLISFFISYPGTTLWHFVPMRTPPLNLRHSAMNFLSCSLPPLQVLQTESAGTIAQASQQEQSTHLMEQGHPYSLLQTLVWFLLHSETTSVLACALC